MKTYDLDLHLFNKVNKPKFCGAICAPCLYTFCGLILYYYQQQYPLIGLLVTPPSLKVGGT